MTVKTGGKTATCALPGPWKRHHLCLQLQPLLRRRKSQVTSTLKFNGCCCLQYLTFLITYMVSA